MPKGTGYERKPKKASTSKKEGVVGRLIRRIAQPPQKRRPKK